MAQTGDPTGTGRGGVSIYGYTTYCYMIVISRCYDRAHTNDYVDSKQFEDEITPALKHMGAGVISFFFGSQYHIIIMTCLDGTHK
jgi:cyclophilin family peptidyl-prolyl cis-trans isomerase